MCVPVLTTVCRCGGQGRTLSDLLCHSPSYSRETGSLDWTWSQASSLQAPAEPPLSAPDSNGVTDTHGHTWLFMGSDLRFSCLSSMYSYPVSISPVSLFPVSLNHELSESQPCVNSSLPSIYAGSGPNMNLFHDHEVNNLIKLSSDIYEDICSIFQT